MSWPFWRITNHSDMAALHHALDLGYLWWRHNRAVMTLHSSNAARTEWHVASLWRRMTSLRTEWSTSVWKQYLLKKPAKFPIHRQLKGWSSDNFPAGLPLPSTSTPNFPLSVVMTSASRASVSTCSRWRTTVYRLLPAATHYSNNCYWSTQCRPGAATLGYVYLNSSRESTVLTSSSSRIPGLVSKARLSVVTLNV